VVHATMPQLQCDVSEMKPIEDGGVLAIKLFSGVVNKIFSSICGRQTQPQHMRAFGVNYDVNYEY